LPGGRQHYAVTEFTATLDVPTPHQIFGDLSLVWEGVKVGLGQEACSLHLPDHLLQHLSFSAGHEIVSPPLHGAAENRRGLTLRRLSADWAVVVWYFADALPAV
jgi:hypothetical protein